MNSNPSSTLVAPSSRRHHLSPMKPMKSSHLRGLANSSSRNTTFPSATKRSFAISDENDPSLALLTSPPKRVKSALAPRFDNVLKPKTVLSAAAPNGTSKKKRTFGALLDITNTQPAPKSNNSNNTKDLKSSGGFTKPTRTILKPLSVKKTSPVATATTAAAAAAQPPSPRRARNARATSPRIGSGRGIKRAYSPPAFKRVDPPSSLISSLSSSSIDSLLASSNTSSRTSFSSLDGGVALPPTPPAPAMPESWVFDIYEDTPEETLQNLMEHSTHTLDISDDESSLTSELQERGKENIPPARLATAAAAVVAPRRPHGRVLREHREALREMRKEELLVRMTREVSPDTDCCGGVKLPTIENSEFITFATPEKAKTPDAPGSPGWAVWESDHEGDQEDEEGVKVTEKEKETKRDIKEEMGLELAEMKFEVFSDTSSINGASDKEN